MADRDKKPNYVLWVIIAIGICILCIMIGMYLLWRKISSTEIRIATSSKTVDDMRVTMAKLESELKAKDDKLQEMGKEVSMIRERQTKISYKMKIGEKAQPIKKKTCDDDSCTLDIIDNS